MITAISLIGLLFILVACVKPVPTTPTTPTPGANEVWIIGWNYVPETIAVPEGTTVNWTNTDRGYHTVTSDDNLFDVPPGFGQSFNYTSPSPVHSTITTSLRIPQYQAGSL